MYSDSLLMATGSVALDTLETPFGETAEVLGGSASHFSLAYSRFHPVRLVGVIGEDFPEEYLELFQESGIDMEYLEQKPGSTFRWHGRYTGPMEEAETLEIQLNVHEDFHPPFENGTVSPELLFLGNISPAYQKEMISSLGETPRIVASDTMKLWIETQRKTLVEVLDHVDLFFLNWEEALLLGDADNTLRAARTILEMGPDTVIVKKGEHGAIAVSEDWVSVVPGVPLTDVNDPTGAGDTFAAGVMAVVTQGEVNREWVQSGLILGTIMGSFAVQSFGVNGVRGLDVDRLHERVQSYLKTTGISGAQVERVRGVLP